MCGRTACTLTPDNIQNALCYKLHPDSKFIKPEWRYVSNGGKSYKPSHNTCPTDVTPVMLSGDHFNSKSARIIQPMIWGIIPPWHKGDYKSHKLSTNNCRIENLANSRLYKIPFLKGQRCIVISNGFYEWERNGKGSKKPYFIYMPQPDGVKIEDETTWNVEFNENDGWKGPKLLKMAGIFDSWKSPEGEEIFSYSVITLESNETLSWLHNRMPAILDSEELVSGWLNYGEINGFKALNLLTGIKTLCWHPVSTLVNNTRNKDVNCSKPVAEVTSIILMSGTDPDFFWRDTHGVGGGAFKDSDAISCIRLSKGSLSDHSSLLFKRICTFRGFHHSYLKSSRTFAVQFMHDEMINGSNFEFGRTPKARSKGIHKYFEEYFRQRNFNYE